MALSQQTQQALLSPLGSGMKLNLPMKWKIFHVSRSPCKQHLLGGSISSVLLSSHASTSGVSCRLQLPGRRAQPVPEAAFSRSTTPGSDRLRGHGILPPPPFRPPLPRQGLQAQEDGKEDLVCFCRISLPGKWEVGVWGGPRGLQDTEPRGEPKLDLPCVASPALGCKQFIKVGWATDKALPTGQKERALIT